MRWKQAIWLRAFCPNGSQDPRERKGRILLVLCGLRHPSKMELIRKECEPRAEGSAVQPAGRLACGPSSRPSLGGEILEPCVIGSAGPLKSCLQVWPALWMAYSDLLIPSFLVCSEDAP